MVRPILNIRIPGASTFGQRSSRSRDALLHPVSLRCEVVLPDFAYRREQLNRQLFEAVDSGNEKRALDLIRSGAAVDEKYRFNLTSLLGVRPL